MVSILKTGLLVLYVMGCIITGIINYISDRKFLNRQRSMRTVVLFALHLIVTMVIWPTIMVYGITKEELLKSLARDIKKDPERFIKTENRDCPYF